MKNADLAFAASSACLVTFGFAATFPSLPEDTRIFVGSCVYEHCGTMFNGGFCHTYWSPEKLPPREAIDLCANEQGGNMLQIWQSGTNLLELAKYAASKGISVSSAYASADPVTARRFPAEVGSHWLGYDFGEHFTRKIPRDTDARNVTLRTLAEGYLREARDYIAKTRADGWGLVYGCSGTFALDYELAAGSDFACDEDFPAGDLMLGSALCRGLARQYRQPFWGAYLAHEWYSWIPHKNPYKMATLDTAFYLKYMSGAKLILNESGNFELQSSLCEDSPMSRMPITARCISEKLDAVGREKYVKPVLAEARKKFPMIDCRSPVAVKYRKSIRNFYLFCKEHPAPKGQPETTWALAKGNLDLGNNVYIAGDAIFGAHDLARKNPNWMAGLPEMSWETVRNAVMPMPPMLAPDKNIHFSATPYGICDIASFAFDSITAEHLLRNYKVLMFSGWNTCSPKQYKTLCDYVKGGGILVIGLCHLSTDDARRYTDLSVDKLVNKGDLTELCGFRVKGETARKYWATGPSTRPNDLGFVARRRFGYMCLPLGDLEYAVDGKYVKDAPKERYEMLAVDDEEADPFILRCRTGRGQVLFMNWWAYPAAANMDVGCGATEGSVGMVGRLYQYAAKLGRGNVFITGPDFENPDEDCNWIVCTYFPDEGRIYLLNLDYGRERKCVLQPFGDKEFVTLGPAEFRILDSVKLDPDEKLNDR